MQVGKSIKSGKTSTNTIPITSIDQLDFDQVYTYADYLNWQLKERIELWRGKIISVAPAPGTNHQRVSGHLFLQIGNYLVQKTCEIFSAPFDVRLQQNNQFTTDKEIYTVVQPDLCIICDQGKIDERGCLGAPVLVIEILSPGNSEKEMNEKYLLYEEAGVKEYWMVSLKEQAIIPYILNKTGKFIGQKPVSKSGILKTDLLPGLEISLNEIFNFNP